MQVNQYISVYHKAAGKDYFGYVMSHRFHPVSLLAKKLLVLHSSILQMRILHCVEVLHQLVPID